jgi:N-acetylmuramoyl-L-alanine amidase
LRSWHAGKGKWGSITDMNSISIGIEMDNNGSENFTEPQMNSLLNLLDTLKSKYKIPQANFIGHADWAPGRKNDPSVKFNWKMLYNRGFGLWYNESETSEIQLPESFDTKTALRIIGYDISNLNWAIKSFNRKFLNISNSEFLSEKGKKVLYQIMVQCL